MLAAPRAAKITTVRRLNCVIPTRRGEYKLVSILQVGKHEQLVQRQAHSYLNPRNFFKDGGFMITARRTLPLILLLALVSAHADQLEEANVAHNRGDYATSFRLSAPLAEQGNANAQFNLGVIYENGYGGVTKDLLVAQKWYQKAADQGVAMAANNLAVMYGRNIRWSCGWNISCALNLVNRQEQLYRQAAAQGLLLAKINLGELLIHNMWKEAEGKQILMSIANGDDPELARDAIKVLKDRQEHERAVDENLRQQAEWDREWERQQQEMIDLNRQILEGME